MISVDVAVYWMVFATLICLIVANPANLSKNATESTKLTDLNDDCLYGSFLYLNSSDLENLAASNSRCAPTAVYVFTKKILTAIEDISYSYQSDREIMEKEVLRLNKVLWPANNRYLEDLKIALLLKNMIKTISLDQLLEDNSWFLDAVDSVAKKWLRVPSIFAEFAATLWTLPDHYRILNFITNPMYWNNDLNDGISYIYMSLLEKSKHLRKRFSYAMMIHLGKARNAANAFHLLNTIAAREDDDEFNYVERFTLDWDLHRKGKLSDEELAQYYLAIAKEQTSILHGTNFVSTEIAEIYLKHRNFARTFCALWDLAALNSTELIDATGLKWAIFESAEQMSRIESANHHEAQIDGRVIATFRRALEEKCKGSKIIEIGFQQLKNDFEEILGRNTSHAEAVYALANRCHPGNEQSECEKEFLLKMKSQIDELKSANDFGDYTKLLRMVVNIGFGTVSYNGWRPSLLQQTVNKLALAYFEFVDRPHVFDNLNQLIEVDAVYNELREQHPQADRNKYNFHKISNERNAVRERLTLTFTNFASILSPKPGESLEMRTKQRIILKFLITLALQGYTYDDRFNAEREEQFRKIVELYFTLAQCSGELLAQDSFLSREWILFDRRFSGRFFASFFAREDVEAFQFMHRPYEPTENSARDVIIYLCHLTAVVALSDNPSPKNIIPEQMFDNVLTLEESVDEASVTSLEIRASILEKREKFFRSHLDRAGQKWGKTGLKTFVDIVLNYWLTSRDWHRYIMMAIYDAVEANANDAKAQLGDELIEKFGQISLDYFYKNYCFNDERFRQSYETCKNILKSNDKLSVQRSLIPALLPPASTPQTSEPTTFSSDNDYGTNIVLAELYNSKSAINNASK